MTMYYIWGTIPWGEPRLLAAFGVLLVSAAGWVLSEIVDHMRVRSIVNIVVAVVVWGILTSAAGAHPVDPIGGSNSAEIKLFFAGMILTILGIGAMGIRILKDIATHRVEMEVD